MEKISVFIKVLFSLAIIYLATSIILFTNEIKQTRDELPKIITMLEKVENNTQVDEVILTLRDTIKEVKAFREHIPEILKESKEIRKLTPTVLKSVDNINSNISPILQEIKQTRETIPSILNESKAVRNSIPPILNEIKSTRETIPSILNESKAIRKELPIEITKVEKITQNINALSQQAASGAVQGTLRGIFDIPRNVIEGTGEKLLGTSEKK